MARGQISGVAVTTAAVGGLLIWSGVTKLSIADTLRAAIRGQSSTLAASVTGAQPVTFARNGAGAAGTPVAAAPASLSSGGGPNQALAQAALRYVGVPYLWGGNTSRGLDCSGLVQLSFADIGVKAPRTSIQQYLWSKTRRITRDQVAAGDLIYWPGHIAIALDNQRMVNAPKTGQLVQVEADMDEDGPGKPTGFVRYVGGTTATPRKVIQA